MLQLIDEQMERDDETTAVEQQAMPKKEEYDASLTLFSDGDKKQDGCQKAAGIAN